MAEILEPNESQPVRLTPASELKVGDTLHKERVTKRITLETMSKELKINAKYIRAIEANNYQELPAAPYIRVYMRSMASYLALDPEEILRRFYREKGMAEQEPQKQTEPKDADEKMSISVQKDAEKKSFSWGVIGGVAFLIILAAFISNRFGLMSKLPGKQSSPQIKEEVNEKTTAENEVETGVTAQTLPKTLDVPESNAKLVFNQNAPSTQDSLKLIVNTFLDSTLVHVFSDGVSWKNYLRAGNSKAFFARDSLTVYVENNSGTLFTLNDEELKISGTGEKIFRVDHNGLEFLRKDQWKMLSMKVAGKR